MTDKTIIKFGHIWSVFKYALIPIWIILLVPGIPVLIIYLITTDKILLNKFKKKYPSKRFLIIIKNDLKYIGVYIDTLQARIGTEAVVINEVDLEKAEYKLEKKIYRLGLSRKNYLPALIHIDKTIKRIGLFYAFKDYLKGKSKRINKILKKISDIEDKSKNP